MENLVVVVFKNLSKEKRKVYYTIKVTQIINGSLIETSGFINESDVKDLKVIDMTNKK